MGSPQKTTRPKPRSVGTETGGRRRSGGQRASTKQLYQSTGSLMVLFFLSRRESSSPAAEPCAGAKHRQKYIVILLYHRLLYHRLLQETTRLRGGQGGGLSRTTRCRRYQGCARNYITPGETHSLLGYSKEGGRDYLIQGTKLPTHNPKERSARTPV